MATSIIVPPNAGFTIDNAPTQNSGNLVKSGGVYTAIHDMDTSPTANSTKAVTSGGLYTALAGKQGTLTFDNSPTSGSNNPVKSGGIYTALAAKQNTLSFDSTPTNGSSKPVTSGGIYTAINNAAGGSTFTPSSFTVSASASRFAVHGSNMCTVEYFSTAVSGTNIRAGTTLFTLPSGKRPKAATYALCVFANSNQSMSAGTTPILGTVKLGTDGIVSVYHYNNVSTDLSYHVMLNCSYSIV